MSQQSSRRFLWGLGWVVVLTVSAAHFYRFDGRIVFWFPDIWLNF